MKSSLEDNMATIRKKDRQFMSDLKKNQALLLGLAQQLHVPWLSKKEAFGNTSYFNNTPIVTSLIFLTKKKRTQKVENALERLGIESSSVPEKNLFNGATKGVLKLGPSLELDVHLFHFDQMPVRMALAPPNSLKIVLTDPDFEKTYEKRALAESVFAMNTGILLTIDITNGAINCFTTHKGSKKNIPNASNIDLDTIDLDVLLRHDTVAACLNWVKNYNYVAWTKKVHHLLEDNLAQNEKDQEARRIEQFRAEKKMGGNEIDKWSPKTKVRLKTNLDNRIKQLNKFVDDSLENFEKESNEYAQLLEEITTFQGFVETKSGKNLNLQISEGAISHRLDAGETLLCDFFHKTLAQVNEELPQIGAELQDQIKSVIGHVPKIRLAPLPVDTTSNGSAAMIEKPDKPFERQISVKGIGSLLMELRTPMFMLMPFMMIFALFGALVGEQDKGTIDDSIFFYNDRPSIAITSLPEAKGNEYLTFINDIKDASSERKGIFNKEISSELLSEPQLAVKEILAQGQFGNKSKIEKTLDFYFDRKTKYIYLFLTDTGDREFVKAQLMDPQHKLLSMPSSTRRGFGIGGLIRTLSGLKDYRYLILIGLTGLVLWFVITRKTSMAQEVKKSKAREKQKLNNELKQSIDKGMKSGMQKWRLKIQDTIVHRHKSVLSQITEALDGYSMKQQQTVQRERKKLLHKKQLLKTAKNTLIKQRNEHSKVGNNLNLLENQLKGNTNI